MSFRALKIVLGASGLQASQKDLGLSRASLWRS